MNSVRNSRIPGSRCDSGTASAIGSTSPTITTNSVKSSVCSRTVPNSGVNSAAKFSPPTDRDGLPLMSVPRVDRKMAWNSGKITNVPRPASAGTQNKSPSATSRGEYRRRARGGRDKSPIGDFLTSSVSTMAASCHQEITE